MPSEKEEYQSLDEIIEEVIQRTSWALLTMQNDLGAATSLAKQEEATKKYHSFNKLTRNQALEKIRNGKFILKPV